MDSEKHNQAAQVDDVENSAEAVESSRRKLMTKLAACASAVPAVLATLSSEAAAFSFD